MRPPGARYLQCPGRDSKSLGGSANPFAGLPFPGQPSGTIRIPLRGVPVWSLYNPRPHGPLTAHEKRCGSVLSQGRFLE